MISAEQLDALHTFPELVTSEVAISLIDEVVAARARIAELEAACKALYADAHGDGFDSGPSFVQEDSGRMSDVELFAALVEHKIDLTCSGSAWWATSVKLPNFEKGECPRSAIANCVAAILRRLGQTT